jgi:hypothetical protein
MIQGKLSACIIYVIYFFDVPQSNPLFFESASIFGGAQLWIVSEVNGNSISDGGLDESAISQCSENQNNNH